MDIDICACTYRRTHVAETLRSLARLVLKPDWKIRVIVADNDDAANARAPVEATARECGLTLTYIHAPARNISVARNACLDAATAPLVAFIDDDEIAEPGWLAALVATLESSKADAVLGPVRAVYGPEYPTWMRAGDFHSTKPVWVKGEIRTGYTCNVLLRRSAAALQGLRFRKEFGRTGGEDTIFFAALYRAGGKIAFAPDAVVTEAVPAERATFWWLLKRRFRAGQTHGLLLLEDSGMDILARAKNIIVAGAKADFCLFVAAFNIARSERLRYWLLRGTLHAGVVARLLSGRGFGHYG